MVCHIQEVRSAYEQVIPVSQKLTGIKCSVSHLTLYDDKEWISLVISQALLLVSIPANTRVLNWGVILKLGLN